MHNTTRHASLPDVAFDTATVVQKEDRPYPIFLVTARRAPR